MCSRVSVARHALYRLTGALGQDLVHRSPRLQDLARLDLDIVAWPWLPPEGWWIMILELGSAKRLPLAPEASRKAPMLAAMPVTAWTRRA